MRGDGALGPGLVPKGHFSPSTSQHLGLLCPWPGSACHPSQFGPFPVLGKPQDTRGQLCMQSPKAELFRGELTVGASSIREGALPT